MMCWHFTLPSAEEREVIQQRLSSRDIDILKSLLYHGGVTHPDLSMWPVFMVLKNARLENIEVESVLSGILRCSISCCIVTSHDIKVQREQNRI